MKRAILWAARLGVACYALTLGLVLLSHITGDWPFILFASFTPHLLVVLPAILLTAFFTIGRWITPLLGLSIFAVVIPFLSTDFAEPTGEPCSDDCTTLVMANLRQHEPALNALPSQIPNDTDVVVLVELPIEATESSLLAQYPMNGRARVVLLEGTDRSAGSRIAVISREGGEAAFHSVPQGRLRPRRIAVLDTPVSALRIIGVHPLPPISAEYTRLRDTTLLAAAEFTKDTNRFVMIGDFNTTPWEPLYRQLPGRRAGDPRFIKTWNARSVTPLVIDHAFVGDGLEVIDAGVLPDVGSDHYPIRLTVRPR